MYRTYVYLPEELRVEIEAAALSERKSKAAVIRKALESGIKKIRTKKFSSTAVLLKIAKAAKKFKGTAPKDLSRNHDKYIWD